MQTDSEAFFTALGMSQSPFSSGEVFHAVADTFVVTVIFNHAPGLNPLLVAGKYSTN